MPVPAWGQDVSVAAAVRCGVNLVGCSITIFQKYTSTAIFNEENTDVPVQVHPGRMFPEQRASPTPTTVYPL